MRSPPIASPIRPPATPTRMSPYITRPLISASPAAIAANRFDKGGKKMKPACRLNIGLALAASAMLAAPAADARITKIVVDTALSQKPTFGGFSWPGVGQYEKIIGTAYGEVNPSDPRNSVIVDIELAPHNASGNVEYSFDFYILKRINLGNGANKVMTEPPNPG